MYPGVGDAPLKTTWLICFCEAPAAWVGETLKLAIAASWVTLTASIEKAVLMTSAVNVSFAVLAVSTATAIASPASIIVSKRPRMPAQVLATLKIVSAAA